MGTIERSEVGAHVTGKVLQLGLYLPGIRAADGFQVRARIIHGADQFVPEIPAVSRDLTFDPKHPQGLWTLELDLPTVAKPAGSHFGDDGQYLYRFQLLRKQGQNEQIVTPVFLDPFATENGPGLLGVFSVGKVEPFVWSDADYKTPPLDELIIYELNVAQFYGSFAGVAARLDYIDGLGGQLHRADADHAGQNRV